MFVNFTLFVAGVFVGLGLAVIIGSRCRDVNQTRPPPQPERGCRGVAVLSKSSLNLVENATRKAFTSGADS